jgi:hypothetical protein
MDFNPTFAATFTWVPASGQTAATDPPPTEALISESCGINVGSIYSRPISGPANYPVITADTTLGGGSVGNQGGIDISDTRYSVYNNGGQKLPTFTLPSVSPTCDVSKGSGVYFNVTVNYSATATPFEISTAGDTFDSTGQYNILIGQGLTSKLTSTGLVAQSNWQWSISGGTPVDYFNATAGAGPTAYGSASDTSTNTTTCYFTQGDSAGATPATIQCTVNLTPPAGDYPTGGFTATATKKENVWAPTCSSTPLIGTVQNYLTNAAESFIQLQSVLIDTPNSDGTLSGEAAGLDWSHTTVTTPSEFTSYGYGTWSVFQLVTPYETYDYEGSWSVIAGYLNTDSKKTAVSVYGLQAADEKIPYGGLLFSADGETSGNSDSPGWLLNSSLYMLEYIDDNAFADTIMYEPPSSGVGIIWVPLANFNWSFNFEADKELLTNSWVASNESASTSAAAATSTYPTWNYTLFTPNSFMPYVSN